MKRGGGFEYEGCAIFIFFSFFFYGSKSEKEGRSVEERR